MFAVIYKLLSWLYLDWPSLLVVIPRVVVQAPLAAAADYHVFKLASLLYGSKVGWYAVSWMYFGLLQVLLFLLLPLPLLLLLLLFFILFCYSPFSPSNTHSFVIVYVDAKAGNCTALTSSQLLWNLASWFIFYCITRTLSNSAEAALTPVVLYFWLLAIQAGGEGKVQRY